MLWSNRDLHTQFLSAELPIWHPHEDLIIWTWTIIVMVALP